MSAKKRKRGIVIVLVMLAAVGGGLLWHFYPQVKDKAEEAILEQALSGQEDVANIVFKMF